MHHTFTSLRSLTCIHKFPILQQHLLADGISTLSGLHRVFVITRFLFFLLLLVPVSFFPCPLVARSDALLLVKPATPVVALTSAADQFNSLDTSPTEAPFCVCNCLLASTALRLDRGLTSLPCSHSPRLCRYPHRPPKLWGCAFAVADSSCRQPVGPQSAASGRDSPADISLFESAPLSPRITCSSDCLSYIVFLFALCARDTQAEASPIAALSNTAALLPPLLTTDKRSSHRPASSASCRRHLGRLLCSARLSRVGRLLVPWTLGLRRPKLSILTPPVRGRRRHRQLQTG